ncbi:MAG: formylglycine-generating enzyme family protein [Isosphaeraceae bacterium]
MRQARVAFQITRRTRRKTCAVGQAFQPDVRLQSLTCARPITSAGLLGLAIALVMLGAHAARAAVLEVDEPASPDSMKPYVETIPGTEVKFEMLPIPGGSFEMGSPDSEAHHAADEAPRHPVQIAPFWMAKCEATWEEYDQFAFALDLKKKKRDGVDLAKQVESEKKADAVTRPTPPYADETFGHGRNGQPVICITHHAAMEYCRWLSAKTGKIYRLPTEAEWEYACRAGSKTAYFWGDEAGQIEGFAWYVNNAEKPMPVGKKKPNPWGLLDIHGNVAEWCVDHYAADTYKKYPTDKPTVGPVVLPDAKEYPYAVRGGSWDDDAEFLRSAARKASNREWSTQDPQRPQSIWWHTDATFVGFRVVRPLVEQDNLKGLKSLVVKGKGTR